MKKLFMLCLAVAVCAPVSWAQKNLNHTLAKKAAAARSAAAYQKAQIRLTVTHYQLEDYVNPAVSNQIFRHAASTNHLFGPVVKRKRRGSY